MDHSSSNTVSKKGEDRKKLKELKQKLKVRCLTVSDRAFNKEYETGDLSGKAMLELVKEYQEVFD